MLFLSLQNRPSAGFTAAKAELVVDGYTCSMCGLSVQKSLQGLSFIRNIENDLNSTKMILTFAPGATVDPGSIAKKVKEAGFSVASMTYIFDHEIKLDADTIRVNNFEYGYCLNDSIPVSNRIRVIGKNLLNKKEQQKILQSGTCAVSGHTYWLLPL